jgi:hypothetical protein
MKIGGDDGWADVWKRGCFGWEYKAAIDEKSPKTSVVTTMAGAWAK